ncbi:hypothetical protein ACFSNO_31625 [Streptomyces cirratus]
MGAGLAALSRQLAQGGGEVIGHGLPPLLAASAHHTDFTRRQQLGEGCPAA